MNKAELIRSMAAQTKLTQKDTGILLDAMAAEIVRAVAKGEKVQLRKFGTFTKKKRGARTAINPSTKKPMKIAACKVPMFKAGRAWKDALN